MNHPTGNVRENEIKKAFQKLGIETEEKRAMARHGQPAAYAGSGTEFMYIIPKGNDNARME